VVGGTRKSGRVLGGDSARGRQGEKEKTPRTEGGKEKGGGGWGGNRRNKKDGEVLLAYLTVLNSNQSGFPNFQGGKIILQKIQPLRFESEEKSGKGKMHEGQVKDRDMGRARQIEERFNFEFCTRIRNVYVRGKKENTQMGHGSHRLEKRQNNELDTERWGEKKGGPAAWSGLDQTRRSGA